jgi:hypothetical protein
MCGVGVVIVGLGLYSYYVRELLASLFLFSVGFIFLGVVVLGLFLIWSASVQVAIWTRPASRNIMALSRRLVAAYARP